MRIHFSETCLERLARCLCLVVCGALAVPASGHGAAPEKLGEVAAALQRTPGDPGLLFEQSGLLVEHGDHELARQNLDRVDALAPGAFATDCLRAQLLLDEGEPARALECLNRAVTRAPSDPWPLTLRARTRLLLGERDGGLADYREAWQATALPRGDFTIEVADAFISAERIAEAAAVLEKGVRSAGKAPSLLLRLIDVEVRLGRPGDAVVWAEAMQAQAPRPELWMARRAELLELAGRDDEAQALWTALREHLARLPSLDRGSPALRPLFERVDRATRKTPASI